MRSARRRAAAILGSTLALAASVGLLGHGLVSAGAPAGYASFVERISAAQIGIGRPLGVAYAADRGELVVLDAAPGRAARLRFLTRYGEAGATSTVGVTPDGSAFAYDPRRHALLVGDAAGHLGAVATGARPSGSGALPAVAPSGVDGMAIDPRDGSVIFLSGRQLRRSTPAADGTLPAGAAFASVSAGAGHRLVGPAVGANGSVFVLDADASRLVELGPLGELRSTRAITDATLVDPRGIVIAPSGDQTDAPSITSLYIADAGTASGRGAGVVEVALSAPVISPQAAAVAAVPASLVQTIDTSNNGPWGVSSTDPSGIAWASWNSRLIMTDGEIEEPAPSTAPWWDGANGFVLGTDGSQLSTFDVNQYGQNEPVGTATDPSTHFLYSSHDGERRVFVFNPGGDGQFNGVGDSKVRDFFITGVCDGAMCVDDPEGLAFQAGHLYIGDAHGKELWDVAPGPNGIFDGTPANGGDDVLLSHFDTAALGQNNPEGLDYSPASNSFWMVSNVANNRFLSEVSLNGTLLQEISLDAIPGIDSPSGVAIAPRSTNPSLWSAYIADRGIDNSVDPNENDGKIFEVAISFGSGPSPTPTPTPTPTATPTPTPRTVVRLAGTDRYGTAAKVSTQIEPSPGAGVPAVYVASGLSFADALAGGPAAAERNGTLLLVNGSTLPSATAAELTRLKPNTIYLLGGTGVVSAGLEIQLRAYARSGTVIRLAGADRYGTAAATVADAFPGTSSAVMVATGEAFPDALAGGGAASHAGIPILLVHGNSIPTATAQQLTRLKPSTIYVLGGTGAVSAGVETSLGAYAATVTRIAGADRYQTAVAVSKRFFSSASGAHVWVATGSNFPDALAAGAGGDSILLTNTSSLPASVATEIGRLDPNLTNVLGGPTIVSDAVITQIRAIP